MRLFAVLFFIVLAPCCYGQLPAKIRLSTIFPVDSITKITVTNFSGTHKLTDKELLRLKALLKKATLAGGLFVKPTHITLKITLKQGSLAKPGFTYCTTGSLYFQNGTDRWGRPFVGTFRLPEEVNFDNYR